MQGTISRDSSGYDTASLRKVLSALHGETPLQHLTKCAPRDGWGRRVLATPKPRRPDLPRRCARTHILPACPRTPIDRDVYCLWTRGHLIRTLAGAQRQMASRGTGWALGMTVAACEDTIHENTVVGLRDTGLPPRLGRASWEGRSAHSNATLFCFVPFQSAPIPRAWIGSF